MVSHLNTIIAFDEHKITEQINLPDVKDNDIDMVVERYKAFFQQSIIGNNIVMIKDNGYPLFFKNNFIYIEQHCDTRFNFKNHKKNSLVLVCNNHKNVLNYNIFLSDLTNKNNDVFVGVKNFYLMSNYAKKYMIFFTDKQKVLILNTEKFDVINIKKRTEDEDKIREIAK